MVRNHAGSAYSADGFAQDASSAASLRFLLLGDTGVGKSSFVDAFLSTTTNVVSRERIQETIGAPLTSAPAKLPEIRVQGVRARTAAVFQPELDASSPSAEDDPLGLVPPRLTYPARELTFLDFPGYSSTTSPQSTLTLTDNYLNHHLHSVTSIFSPTIPSAQLAWFLITGSSAHSLPTCAFYFVLYELKPIDILYMQMLHERLCLIPVLIKADSLPQREVWVLKKRLVRQLKLNGIRFHTFGLTVEEIEARIEQRQPGGAPFAISAKRDTTSGQLHQSDLEQLVHLCLYSQIRPLQEEGARRVITWKRDYGPKPVELGSASGYEQAWREKSVAPSPVPTPSSLPLNTAAVQQQEQQQELLQKQQELQRQQQQQQLELQQQQQQQQQELQKQQQQQQQELELQKQQQQQQQQQELELQKQQQQQQQQELQQQQQQQQQELQKQQQQQEQQKQQQQQQQQQEEPQQKQELPQPEQQEQQQQQQNIPPTVVTQPDKPGFSNGNYSTPVYTPQTTYSPVPTSTTTPGPASAGVSGYFSNSAMASSPASSPPMTSVPPAVKAASGSGQVSTPPLSARSIYAGYTVPQSFGQQQQQTPYSPPPSQIEASGAETEFNAKALPTTPPSLAAAAGAATFIAPPPSTVTGTSTSGVSPGATARISLPGSTTGNFSPPPRSSSTSSASMVVTNRQEMVESETGLVIDGSERPNVIMDTPGPNTVHAAPMGQQDSSSYYISPPGFGNAVESVEMINPDGTKVKVEIPNSVKSYHPAPSEVSHVTSVAASAAMTNTTTILSPFAGPGGISYFAADPAMAAFLQPAITTAAPTGGYQFIEMDIWEAAETGDVAAVQAHLMNGASPDQRNNSRSTLLHRTAWQSANPYEVMRLLISYNANVNLTNENGNTVLQNVLMKHDDPRLIKLLLDNGADTSITNKEGMNTLEVAALFHRLESARYLLENDFASSEPGSLSLALNRAKSPDKKAMKALLRSYLGSEGEKKRLALAQRIQLLQLALNHQHGSPIPQPGVAAVGGEAASPSGGQHQQVASSSASSVHGSTAVASDSASVRSFEGAKEQGKPGNKSVSVYQDGSEHMRTSSVSLGKNSAGRFNLKNMRAAAPSMSTLFGRKN